MNRDGRLTDGAMIGREDSNEVGILTLYYTFSLRNNGVESRVKAIRAMLLLWWFDEIEFAKRWLGWNDDTMIWISG